MSHRRRKDKIRNRLDAMMPFPVSRRAHRCDETRHHACDARKQRQQHTRDRSHLPGLTGRQTRLLKRLSDGWQLGVLRGLCLMRDHIVSAAKVLWADVKALIAGKYITALFALTLAGRALLDHCGTPDHVTSKQTLHAPVKRIIAAGNSLSDSEKLRIAASRIGMRA